VNILKVTLIIILFSSVGFSICKNDSLCNSYYLKGLEALQGNDSSLAETDFKKSISERHDIQAYLKLTQLYFTKGTINYRDRAKELIQKAILNNPKSIDCRLLYALLLEQTGYKHNALDEYGKAYAIDSSDARTLIAIGKLEAEEFNEYKNSVMIDNTAHSFTNLAGDCFYASEKYLKKALTVDSLNTQAIMQIAFLYEDANKPLLGIPYLERLAKKRSLEKNAHLYLALLYYKTGKVQLSYPEYQKAIELMKPEERNDFIYNSAKMLIDPTNSGKYDSLSENDFKTKIELYWKANDPLYLTKYNERLLEHYSRVAYANLRFSYKDTPGWKTDRGEVYIRYGEPVSKTRLRAQYDNTVTELIDFSSPLLSSIMPLSPNMQASYKGYVNTRGYLKTDMWDYGDITLGFVDESQEGKFQFSRKNNTEFKGQFFGESTEERIKYLRRNVPVTYTPNLGRPLFSLIAEIVQFKGANLTDILINYAAPLKKETASSSLKESGYKYGMFLFDGEMKELFSAVDSVKNSDKTKLVSVLKDTIYAINSLKISAPPIKCFYSFEAIRNEDNGAARKRDVLSIRKFPEDSLTVSDIILADDVEPATEKKAPINRKNLSIYPNPSHAFSNDKPLFIYYEAYNLKMNSEKIYNFEQKLIVEKIDNEQSGITKAVNSVLGLVGLAKSKDYLSLTSKYQVKEKDAPVYLQIDMTDYIPGDYTLKIAVKDLESGEESSAQTNIIWEK
jgi:GWxTD domain-containing protein